MATAPARKFEVLVSRIPWTAAAKELKTYFGQFGKIKHCYLPFDTNTGFHKGYSWIVFSKESELNSALEKRPHILEGKKIFVQRSSRSFSDQKPDQNIDID